jgi:non-specific serine/threonine protein kinase
MGEVHLALDTQLERKVALKVLPDSFAGDPSRLDRFVREAKAASALNHPNILTVYEIGTETGTHYIATELVDGVTIREWVRIEPRALVDVLDACSQVALALAAAHEAGIVHRDVKPENLMLRRDGFVKVLDFGLAKRLISVGNAVGSDPDSDSAPTEPPITQPGTVIGTVQYMSPEQACGVEVDARTDVWSFGVVLYELLAGRPPFTGPTSMHTLVAIVGNEPVPVEQFVPGIPEELARIVTKTLRKPPEERYPSAGELARDLLRLKEDLEAERRASGSDSGASEQVRTGENTPRVTRSAPVAALAPPTNLAPPDSVLIGRERELDDVMRLLRRDDVRLVTLTGAGGTGKTTLAYEVARALLAEFPGGVFTVELAPLSDPELVASEIAKAVGAKEIPGRTTMEALGQRLEEHRMLLLLDNFEHLLDAAPLVAELLALAPRLKVLVTSRALLRLRLERERALDPLELPLSASPPSAEGMASVPAVALFVSRAREVRPTFALTADNAGAVAEICRRLDGLPLGIELAAARMKMNSPSALLARLDERLTILTGGARDLPERQRTMRGAIRWSYDLLDEGERRAFERLAVFAGGCSLEAAEAVVGLDPGAPDNVLDAVTSLVEKSLVRRAEHTDGEARFRMLEVVREYALERLREGGEADEVERRHAEFFLSLGEAAERAIWGVRGMQELERLGVEHDNLRTALRWLLANDVVGCLRLAAAVSGFWDLHGHYAVGRAWLAAALEGGAAAPALERARVLYAAGHLALRQGDLAAARDYSERSLRTATEVGDPLRIAYANHGLGTVAMQQGDVRAARTHLEEALAKARSVGNDRIAGVTLNGLGEVARMEHDWVAARTFYEQAVALLQGAGNQTGASVILCNLGAVACEEGDLAAASARYREALALARGLGDKAVASWTLDGLAAVAAKQDGWQRAAPLAGAADALRDAIGAKLAPIDDLFRERYLAEVRRALDETTFDAAWRAGRELTLEQAAGDER